MSKWGETTGASSAGIRMLADPASDFTKSIGTEFTVPPIGFLTVKTVCFYRRKSDDSLCIFGRCIWSSDRV